MASARGLAPRLPLSWMRTLMAFASMSRCPIANMVCTFICSALRRIHKRKARAGVIQFSIHRPRRRRCRLSQLMYKTERIENLFMSIFSRKPRCFRICHFCFSKVSPFHVILCKILRPFHVRTMIVLPSLGNSNCQFGFSFSASYGLSAMGKMERLILCILPSAPNSKKWR
jgi:hypothetical protein